ncbi:MAG: glycosyltransferase [Candidatus Binatia bacterium]
MRTAFITWYPYCRRSDAIAAALGGVSHLIHYLDFKRPLHAPIKYPLQTATTLRVLWSERPDLVLVAVPPVFAAIPALVWARRSGAICVVDAHTGVFLHDRWSWLLPLTRAVFRRADAVVVTNDHLAGYVRAWGGRAVVIGDVPVDMSPGCPPSPCNGPRVVVVNSFSVDEPVGEVLAAARLLPEASFFVTGDVRHAAREWLDGRPSNLTFTGFMPEDEYAGLLRAADVIVVLTRDDHTMQRGGYEAVAVGRPLVVSDWGLLRETFSRGTVHVHNNAEEIAAGIRSALAGRDRLVEEMGILRAERAALFRERLAALVELVDARRNVGTRAAAHER